MYPWTITTCYFNNLQHVSFGLEFGSLGKSLNIFSLKNLTQILNFIKKIVNTLVDSFNVTCFIYKPSQVEICVLYIHICIHISIWVVLNLYFKETKCSGL